MTPQLIPHTTKTAIPSWPWNSTVRTNCDDYTGLFHPYSWKTPVAAATVYSAPDEGRKGRPKHVEFWNQIKSKNL